MKNAVVTITAERGNENFEIPEIGNFFVTLSNEIDTRFPRNSYESNPMYTEATLLDPRFKRHGFQSVNTYQEAKKSIIARGQSIIRQQQRPTENTSSLETPSRSSGTANSTSIWYKFDSQVKEIVQRSDPCARIIVELDKYSYLNEPLHPRTEDPLEWWSLNKNVYPILFEIMKQRFCIQATSVPSERIFSKAGQVVTERRNRLGSSKINEIVFLNVN